MMSSASAVMGHPGMADYSEMLAQHQQHQQQQQQQHQLGYDPHVASYEMLIHQQQMQQQQQQQMAQNHPLAAAGDHQLSALAMNMDCKVSVSGVELKNFRPIGVSHFLECK